MKLTASQVLEAILECKNTYMRDDGEWDVKKLSETVERLSAEIIATKDLPIVHYTVEVEKGYGDNRHKEVVKRSALAADASKLVGVRREGGDWTCIHLPTGLKFAGKYGWKRDTALKVARTVLQHADRKKLASKESGVAAKAFNQDLLAWMASPDGEFKEVKHAGQAPVEKAG